MPDVTTSSHDPVRVLWLTKGLGPGGAERLLLSFAAHADRQKFDFRVAYLLPWKDHLVDEFSKLGIPVTCLDGSPMVDLRWLSRLRRLVRKDGIEIVHAHSPLVAAFSRPALRCLPRSTRPSLVGTEHNVWSSHHRFTAWANRMTLPMEDVTMAVSEQVRSSMPAALRRRTDVVVHGVDVTAIEARREEREPARSELGVGQGDVLVATVANLRANKDYPTMLQAARLMVDRGAPVRFVSVGQGPLAAEIEEQIGRLGLRPYFTLLGYRADPVRVLVAADIFWLSSRFEGLPIALLEAMAAGLPVVATRVGGIATVVTDGREGRLVEPGNPMALAEAVNGLLDADVRRSHAAFAAERVKAFEIDSAIRRQEAVYARLAVPR